MTAASTAAKYLTDNRFVVGGKDDAGVRIAILPTLPDGKAFTAKKADGTAATGTANVGVPTIPAYIGSADVATVTVPLDFATTVATPNGVTSKYARRQFFRDTSGRPNSGKWCYTNAQGWPLLATGVKAASVAAAANADVVALSAIGEAVPNWTQPGPFVGTHSVSERQQGYARYLGWTVQKGW